MAASATSIKLTADVKDRVQRLASARQRTAHWVMKEAIEQYVSREEKRDAFDRETVEAWEEYQRTGLHLTHEEVDAWLAELEAGNDIEPPECHV